MARKTPSRLQLRKQVEAADKKKTAKKTTTKKKKATPKKITAKKATVKKTKTRAKRAKKVKTPQRKRMIWGVFSGSLKEEARFPYDQRSAAEDKIKQLRARATKKMYFIQPIKEPIEDVPVVEEE